MKKLFLISLMAMLCTVMAWADDAHVSNITDLKAAIANASVETIYLDADIQYAETGNSSCINILRSLTIDGQGHTLSGYGKRGTTSNYPTVAINQGGGSKVDVTLKNISIVSTYSSSFSCRPIETRGNINSLTLNNVVVATSHGGSSQAITIGGNQATKAEINIINSQINAGTGGYPIISFNPFHLVAENTTFTGYCGLYFKGEDGSAGSRGTVIDATNCDFDAPNIHSGKTNGFGVFCLEDDGITINLHNCGMNAQMLGNASQRMFLLQDYTAKNRRANNVVLNISGDNSHINGAWVTNNWVRYLASGTSQITNSNYLSIVDKGIYETGEYRVYDPSTSEFTEWKIGDANKVVSPWPYAADITINISGGTYSIDLSEYEYEMHRSNFRDTTIDEETTVIWNSTKKKINIADGYEVQEVMQGDVTLYRVVKKAATYIDPETSQPTLYDLNADVPTDVAGEGNNPATSFELSTGGEMKLDEDREVTKAGYVQVKDNEDTGDATTVKVGTTSTSDPTQKVDQTLIVNNGLDVQGDSKVEVQAGSTVIIGEGGINTENPENIVIEADENGSASLLLNPAITVNQNPKLTVKMKASLIGRDADGDYNWHRFALPVNTGFTTWTKEGDLVPADPNYEVQYPTYVYAWDYANNDWENIAPAAMVPMLGYTLTLASDYIHVNGAGQVVSEDTDGGNLNVQHDVTYIFTGDLVGNSDKQLEFQHDGFNFFGNSYTAYIKTATLVQSLIGNSQVAGTVYTWNVNNQSYDGASLYNLINRPGILDPWQTEIAPMQTFILQLRSGDPAEVNVKVDYASAIWGNPRYGNEAGGSAPARVASEEAFVKIKVVAANGMSDAVLFTENADYSDAYENGADVNKYMNVNRMNLYTTIDNEDYSSIVTDNIAGKTLSLHTINDVNYTMSFSNVEGTQYAIRDLMTNIVTPMTEGNTYTFAAQPNSTVEGRFVIVPIQNMPTAVETVETTPSVKGIYTIMGQYVGEDFESLPAGVYVVDGVKVVK